MENKRRVSFVWLCDSKGTKKRIMRNNSCVCFVPIKSCTSRNNEDKMYVRPLQNKIFRGPVGNNGAGDVSVGRGGMRLGGIAS